MKTETCKLYSRDLWIFLPKIIKIDCYNSELYRFKVGAFFWAQCSSVWHTSLFPFNEEEANNNNISDRYTQKLQISYIKKVSK